MVFIIAAAVVICLAIAFFMGISAGRTPPIAPTWHEFTANPLQDAVSHAGSVAIVPAIALIIYGHRARDTARRLAIVMGRNCIAVEDLKTLQIILRERWFMGVVARVDGSNRTDAGKAIKLFRKYYPDAGVAIYAAWDEDIEQAAQQALACQADGIVMPDLDATATAAYLTAVIERIERDEPRPATVAEHRDLLASLLLVNNLHQPQVRLTGPSDQQVPA
jgi:hypothetical protein